MRPAVLKLFKSSFDQLSSNSKVSKVFVYDALGEVSGISDMPTFVS